MTSFPNVYNVLTDRAASGSRSALSKGPTFLSMSRALKDVPQLAIMRTFSR